MAWIILTILCVVAIGGALIVFMSATAEDTKMGAIATFGIAVLAEAAISIAFSVATIGTGQVGLQYNFAGKLVGRKDVPGVIWKAPWTSIKKESVQIQREQFILDSTNEAVTKDQQEITANLAVNYQVDPKHVLDLYRRVGPSWKAKLIDSRVLQDFKEVTATYPTVLITQRREELRKDTRDKLRKELAPYSIDVTDFFIQNIGFSKAYQDAITAKQVQVQQAQQAEAKVAQAHAEAQQVVQTAQGEAEAIKLKGKALAEYPEVLKLQAITKLNPHAQIVFCSNGNCPSFLGSLSGTNGK